MIFDFLDLLIIILVLFLTDSASAARIQLTSLQQHQLLLLQQRLQQLRLDLIESVHLVSSTVVKMMVLVPLCDQDYVPVPFVMDKLLQFFKRQQRDLSQEQLQQLQKLLQLQIREDMTSISLSIKWERRQQRKRRDTEKHQQQWKAQEEQLRQIHWLQQMLPLFWVMLAISLVEQRHQLSEGQRRQTQGRLQDETINELEWAFALLDVEKRQLQHEEKMEIPPKQVEQREPLLRNLEQRLLGTRLMLYKNMQLQ